MGFFYPTDYIGLSTYEFIVQRRQKEANEQPTKRPLVEYFSCLKGISCPVVRDKSSNFLVKQKSQKVSQNNGAAQRQSNGNTAHTESRTSSGNGKRPERGTLGVTDDERNSPMISDGLKEMNGSVYLGSPKLSSVDWRRSMDPIWTVPNPKSGRLSRLSFSRQLPNLPNLVPSSAASLPLTSSDGSYGRSIKRPPDLSGLALSQRPPSLNLPARDSYI